MHDQNDTAVLATATATAIAVAWLANPHTRAAAADVAPVLRALHEAVQVLTTPAALAEAAPAPAAHTPAVSVRKSLASPDHIVSMLDGKPYKALKRHLSANGLTPAEYRERYRLKADYPMTAPAYSAARSATSKALGPGRKAQVADDPVAEVVAKPQRKKLGIAAAKAAAKDHLGG